MKIVQVKFKNMLGTETTITKKEMKFTYKDMLDYVNIILLNYNNCEIVLNNGEIKTLSLNNLRGE